MINIDYDKIYNIPQASSYQGSGVQLYRIVERLISKQSHDILDVGCGEGQFMSYIKSKRSVYIKGFDINRKKVVGCLSNDLDVFYCDITKHTFSSQYDTIIALQLLEHISNWQEILMNMINNAREVIVSVPYSEPEKPPIPCFHCHKLTNRSYHVNFLFTEETFRALLPNHKLFFKILKKSFFAKPSKRDFLKWFRYILSRLPGIQKKHFLIVRIMEEDQD